MVRGDVTTTVTIVRIVSRDWEGRLMKCSECDSVIPLHLVDCYHYDCDSDDWSEHGCGVEMIGHETD